MTRLYEKDRQKKKTYSDNGNNKLDLFLGFNARQHLEKFPKTRKEKATERQIKALLCLDSLAA